MPPEAEVNPRRKRSSMSLAAGIVIVAIVAACGLYVWKHVASTRAVSMPTPSAPLVSDTVTFASSTMKISLTYPKDFTVDELYSNTSVNPKKPIRGVKFTVPLTMATGTNLSSDTGISVEQLPRARNCTGDIYLAANVKAQSIVDGAITYSVATSSDAGAGNVYEEVVYALTDRTPCTAVRYFIHSTQFENYPPGMVTQFDRAALLSAFDTIRRSLIMQ